MGHACCKRLSSGRVQVAHFLEADMRPWVLRLANCLFPGCVLREDFHEPYPDVRTYRRLLPIFRMIRVDEQAAESDGDVDGAARQQQAWLHLDELAPLGDTCLLYTSPSPRD